MRNVAFAVVACALLAACGEKSPTEASKPPAARNTIVAGTYGYTHDVAYVDSFRVEFESAHFAQFKDVYPTNGFSLFNHNGDGIVIDKPSGHPQAAFELGGVEMASIYNQNPYTRGMNVAGTITALGSPDNSFYGIDVSYGGARFGTNEFTPDAGLFDNQTALMLVTRTGGVVTTKRVMIGAANSGGTGYRTLRIPN